MAEFPERREDSRGCGSQIVQVVAIDTLDPAAVIACATSVSETDLRHGEDEKQESPADRTLPVCTGFPTS
jgi:hypothetical protein